MNTLKIVLMGWMIMFLVIVIWKEDAAFMAGYLFAGIVMMISGILGVKNDIL